MLILAKVHVADLEPSPRPTRIAGATNGVYRLLADRILDGIWGHSWWLAILAVPTDRSCVALDDCSSLQGAFGPRVHAGVACVVCAKKRASWTSGGRSGPNVIQAL